MPAALRRTGSSPKVSARGERRWTVGGSLGNAAGSEDGEGGVRGWEEEESIK